MKYEQLWSNIGDLIRLIIKNSDNCHEKQIKLKFNLGDESPQNKTIKTSIIIVVRAIFVENDKYYPQVFLDACINSSY